MLKHTHPHTQPHTQSEHIKGRTLGRSSSVCETHFLSPATHHTDARMPADYNGTWEMVTNDKFEEVMKAMGKHLLAPPPRNPSLMDNGRDIGRGERGEKGTVERERDAMNTEEYYIWVRSTVMRAVGGWCTRC